jgi:hypothetical protein
MEGKTSTTRVFGIPGADKPSFWVVSWVSINISLTLLNKSVFQFVKFHYPLTLSACHMLCLYLFCFFIYRVFRLLPIEHVSSTTRNRAYMLSLLFTLNICAGNAGLLFSSVSLREVVRSLTPVVTLALSIWLLGKRYPAPVFWSLLPITAGVALTTYTELEFHFWGFIILLVGCFLAALKGVLSNIMLVGSHSVNALYLLYLIAPLGSLQMVLLAYVTGEIDAILAELDQVLRPVTVFMIASTAVLAFFLNVANLQLNKVTSPVTVSVAGSFKEVVTIALSFIVFQNKATPQNLLGIGIALTGTFLYHYTSHAPKHAPSAKTPHNKSNLDQLPESAIPLDELHSSVRRSNVAPIDTRT